MATDIDMLVKRYSNELYGYLCRYTGDFALAQDILSDVFVRLMEQMTKTSDDVAFQWRPWLYRVATNLAISHHRRQKIRSMFLLKKSQVDINDAGPQEMMETSQEGLKVKAAVEALSYRHKAVILMNIYQDMSYEEVADALKISVGTVKSRISIAKQRLKETLKELK